MATYKIVFSEDNSNEEMVSVSTGSSADVTADSDQEARRIFAEEMPTKKIDSIECVD